MGASLVLSPYSGSYALLSVFEYCVVHITRKAIAKNANYQEEFDVREMKIIALLLEYNPSVGF